MSAMNIDCQKRHPELAKSPAEERNALLNEMLRQAQHDNVLIFDILGQFGEVNRLTLSFIHI